MNDSAAHRASPDIWSWLDGHVNLERGIGVPADVARATAPTLERIVELTALLGSPQLDFESIHLTGTNGKTTTARLLSDLLAASAIKSGRYTSPHLEHVTERMTINGEAIAESALEEVLDVVRLAETAMRDLPSYFEILTAAACRWFSDEAVEVAVVEVGLGGTWDATNVIDADIAVVTNIAIDHTNFLGDTRAEIAGEKSGIVKPDALLVLGETDPALYSIFDAREPRAVLLRDRDFRVLANDLAVGGRAVDISTPRTTYREVFLSLHGAHQADNAAIALTAAEAYLDDPVDPDIVREVFGSARSPGRMEIARREPLVVLDGAHNVAGAEALRAALRDAFGSMTRTLVIGLLREKNPTEMLRALGIDEVDRLVVCPPPSPRALDPERVAAAAEAMGMPTERIEVADDVKEAMGIALLETAPDAQVVVTGSLYVVGAARSILARR